jgi:hypothetical protein
VTTKDGRTRSRIDCVTTDCRDARGLAAFWAAALGYEPDEDEEGWVVIRDPAGDGPRLGFQRVPEPKVVKNRGHLDLLPTAGTWEAEVARLEGLGARSVRFVENPPDEAHMVIADPEGNEFCLVQPSPTG